MKTHAALIWEQPGTWKVSEVDLDPPGYGEVLVEMAAAGLCHSDSHMATNDTPLSMLPMCAGHEGAGIVREVGPGVTDLVEGDHLITSFIPACGKCRWCASGMQNLCDDGAHIMKGPQRDGTFRMHADGVDVGTVALLGTFSEWQVLDHLSCVKIEKDIPLSAACLVSCGVPTGWGSATNAAGIQVGDVVVVIGCGGVGINAVQGAAHKGASHVVSVDPEPFKREMAMTLGATEAFANIEDAIEFVRSITNGQGADSAIVTVGVIHGEHINDAFRAIRKGGTAVVTAQGNLFETGVPLNLFEISMYQKRIQGCLYGMTSPRQLIPSLLDLYRQGILKLDELVTRRYRLDDINEGYADMNAGRNIRGIIEYLPDARTDMSRGNGLRRRPMWG